MSQPFDLTRLLDNLKRIHGTLTRSKKWGSEYYLIPISERFNFLQILVQELKDSGKTEEYFNNSVRDRIVEVCIPHEKSVNPQSYAMFKKGTQEHLRMAIAEIYSTMPKAPTREKAFSKEFDPSTIKDDTSLAKDVIDPEMAKLLGYDDE